MNGLFNFTHCVNQISLSTSLYDGIEDCDWWQIQYLLEMKNADPNYIIPDKGISPFHLIAGCEVRDFAIDVTKLFLLHGGDPNVRSVEGATPLHITAAWGQEELLKLLLASGGDPDICDSEGLTAQDYASRENYETIVQILRGCREKISTRLQCDTPPKYNFQLEKFIVTEGDYIAEYVIDTQNETKSTSTQTVNEENTVTNEKLPTSQQENETSNTVDDTMKRTADWCDQQIFFCNNVLKHRQTEELLNNSSASSLHLSEDEQPPSTPSEAFYTCRSKQSTVSSQISSAISEIYKYTDNKHGVTLVEKRLPFTSGTSVTELSESEAQAPPKRKLKLKGGEAPREYVALSIDSNSVSSLPSGDMGYCTEALRRELESRGCRAGPITSFTKRVYLKHLTKLRKDKHALIPEVTTKRTYSKELERSVRNTSPLDLPGAMYIEQIMANQFSNTQPGRKWREGTNKSSFNYLLLDPRVTQNLPLRAAKLSPTQRWETFLQSIFYVGKGKRARPYSHLYEAVNIWNRKSSMTSTKVEHILDIWKDNQGVVCLHIFQNVIPVEAYTREAAMIDAIGLANLKNLKRGEYYGVAASKPSNQQRNLGAYLLYRALHIFLNEGERQLQPADIV